MARRFLSAGSGTGQRARLRGEPPDIDRDQFNVLRLAEAGKLSQVGGRRARGFCVFGQGTALRHQPARPRRGRRFHQALSGFRRFGARRAARSVALAIRADARNSTPPTSANSSNCCRRQAAGKRLRHVVEVRHDSFRTPEFIALLRKFATPVVFTDHAKYPNIADVTGDFVYARLQKGQDTIPTAYPAKDLDAWAGRLRLWAQGEEPDDLPRVDRGARAAENRAARRLCLRHPRGQNSRAGGGHGADRAIEGVSGFLNGA